MNRDQLTAAARKVLEALPPDDPNAGIHVLGVCITHLLVSLSPDPNKDALQFTGFILNDVKQTVNEKRIQLANLSPEIIEGEDGEQS